MANDFSHVKFSQIHFLVRVISKSICSSRGGRLINIIKIN
jgi:hypothetical protein